MFLTKLLASLLPLLFLSSAVSASTKYFLFKTVKRCPTEGASLIDQRIPTKLQCATVCSKIKTCNAFHLRQSTGQCVYGDACSTLTQWTDGDCESYKYSNVLCEDCTADPALSELRVKLFYKFSRSGLVNEADPRQFCLTANNVTVDAGGAQFQGKRSSYLSTETTELNKYIALGLQFSAFVNVRHAFDNSNSVMYYYRFMHRIGFAYFAKYGSKIAASTNLQINTLVGDFPVSLSPISLPTDGLQRNMSMGFVFNGTVPQHFYANGSIIEIDFLTNLNTGFEGSVVDTLYIGNGPQDAECLNGSMLCFAFSSKLLNRDEFQRLQQLCTD